MGLDYWSETSRRHQSAASASFTARLENLDTYIHVVDNLPLGRIYWLGSSELLLSMMYDTTSSDASNRVRSGDCELRPLNV